MGRQLYELIPEEGKHLADSHDTEGAVRGVYLNNETNKPCGAGEFMLVHIGNDEDSSSVSDYIPDESLDGDALVVAGILAFGIGIGVAASKAYPYVRKWVTTKAVPNVKKFWRKVTKTESEPESVIECAETKTMPTLMEPEEFSQNIDQVVNEFYADTSSEETQQHLLNIMCAAIYIASEIRQLPNDVLKSKDRLDWRAAMERLTTQGITDSINCILERKVLSLDKGQSAELAECLNGILIVNGNFVPIENRRIKEALFVYPSDPIENKVL